MKALTVILLCLGIGCMTANLQAKMFLFTGSADALYENPANWIPSYPGTHIEAGDRVLVQADMHLKGFGLIIKGKFELMPSASLRANGESIVIAPHAFFNNYGEVVVGIVENFGTLRNGPASLMQIETFISHTQARTHNAAAAECSITGIMLNAGTFDNYGSCKIGKRLHNHATFNQLRQANLEVQGSLFYTTTSSINQSLESETLVKGSKIEWKSLSYRYPPRWFKMEQKSEWFMDFLEILNDSI